MTNSRVKDYLSEQIVKKMDNMFEAKDLMQSMLDGDRPRTPAGIDPVELEGNLACYRALVETVTIMRIYSDNFETPSIREEQQKFESTLQEIEGRTVSLMKRLLQGYQGDKHD